MRFFAHAGVEAAPRGGGLFFFAQLRYNIGQCEGGARLLQNVDGVALHYAQQGAGADILLLHGWGCDISIWQAVLRRFPASVRVTAVDFPPQGESGKPPATWGVPEYAAQILHLLDALGIARCDVIGHSFGGRVAIWLAAHHPDRVRRLVLTDAAGLKPPPTKKGASRQRLYKVLRGGANLLGKVPGLDEPAANWREALVQRFGSADYKVLDTGMREVFRRVVGLDLQPYLSKIGAPTLLFWGDQDQDTPLWMGQVMEREIPDAGLVVARGAGHYAFLEQLELFWRVVENFLL